MVTFQAHGQVLGIYRDGVLQCYWRPEQGVNRFLTIVAVLRNL